MNRKEIGKWIITTIFAIAMSITFHPEIINADTIEDESIENTISQEETSDEKNLEDETVENVSNETVVANTNVNFYIQLDNAVMDIEGDINFRDTKYFSGSVAKSTIDPNLPTDFQYAGKGTDEDSVFQTDSNIRDTILGQPGYVSNCPNDEDVFLTLQNDPTGKTQAYFQNKDINITELNSEKYSIYWYVVKYHNDGWHVDGILLPKSSNTETDIEPIPEPIPSPTPIQIPTPTPDPGTIEIIDNTPIVPNPSDDVDDNTTVEPTDIDDEDVPLSDEVDMDEEDMSVEEEIDIDDEDVPLADLPTEDDIDILDEEIPLSDNPMTGDNTSVIWSVMAIWSALGLVLLFVSGKYEKLNNFGK